MLPQTVLAIPTKITLDAFCKHQTDLLISCSTIHNTPSSHVLNHCTRSITGKTFPAWDPSATKRGATFSIHLSAARRQF